MFVKVDSIGRIEWNQTYYNGTGYITTLNSLVEAVDGGYALAGTINPPQIQSPANFLLIKTDSNGKMDWTKTYNNLEGGEASANCLTQATTGGYYLAGFIGTILGGYIWVINVDSDGVMIWNSTWPANPQPINPNSLEKTSDDGCIVTGYAGSSGGFNGLHCFFFIFKLASDGNLQWNKMYDTLADSPSVFFAVEAKDGGYVLAGTMAMIMIFGLQR